MCRHRVERPTLISVAPRYARAFDRGGEGKGRYLRHGKERRRQRVASVQQRRYGDPGMRTRRQSSRGVVGMFVMMTAHAAVRASPYVASASFPSVSGWVS
jgi:hypothetical protein